MKKIEEYVTSIPDFPEPGIIFRDITSVIGDPDGLKLAIDSLDGLLEGVDYDVIAGAESRGFIFGTPLAYKNGKGFALVRKKGKLPRETIEASYDLEYGSATIEMHKDAIKPGQKVGCKTGRRTGRRSGKNHILDRTCRLEGQREACQV